MNEVNFCGLLYIDLIENDSINFKSKNATEKIKLYINNAIVLSKSLERYGYNYKLYTNNIDFINENCDVDLYKIDVEIIQFTTKIPRGTRFYSAHKKIDVLNHLSKLSGYHCLLDLDILCLKDPTDDIIKMIANKENLAYDITTHMPDSKISNLNDDLNYLSGIRLDESKFKWYGGEFICGNTEFFKKLMEEIEFILPKYKSRVDKITHVGDESITNAAIRCLLSKGEKITNANDYSYIHRYWSTVKTEHKQESVIKALNSCFIHLPADKGYINNYIHNNLKYFKFRYFIRQFFINRVIIAILKRI